MKRLSQVLAWVLVIGIVSLSIVPPDYRVVTDLPSRSSIWHFFILAAHREAYRAAPRQAE